MKNALQWRKCGVCMAVQQTRRCSSQCVLRWKRTLDDFDCHGQLPCQSYGVSEDEINKSMQPWRCADAWTANCQEWRQSHVLDHLAGRPLDQHEQRHQLTPNAAGWLETQTPSVQTCPGLTEEHLTWTSSTPYSSTRQTAVTLLGFADSDSWVSSAKKCGKTDGALSITETKSSV